MVENGCPKPLEPLVLSEFFDGLKTLPSLRSHDAAPLIRHKKCSQRVQGVLQVGPVHADASAGRSTNTKLALHIYYGAPCGLGSGTPPSLQQEAVLLHK